MGSGGPGEETLDPRDGMGNGDVEEAGGLVMVGVPAFSLLLFCFPFSRARCIDTSWCPSHGVNGSGSGSSFRSHVTDAGGIGGAVHLLTLELPMLHPRSHPCLCVPPILGNQQIRSLIHVLKTRMGRGGQAASSPKAGSGIGSDGRGVPVQSVNTYRKENYAGSKPLPLYLLSGGHEPLIHCHFGQSRNRDRVRLQAQELRNHGIEAAIGRVYAGAMAWDTLKVACLPLVTSFSLARSHCILALLDLKSTPCLAEGKRREEASDSFMHAPLGSGEYSSVGRAELLQLGRCDYGLDV
ncbi:hypothetical protein Sjap_026687 [Stephania japonica]|uniref:Uncharacterized protein n=1 Tax=Stephania japonica TaxID=461633 RepID=A0AAP0DUL8_9MAGN